MDTHLYITRHGQTQWNVESKMQGQKDSPLTALGKEQASKLAGRLSEIDLDIIYSSPSGRAAETAKIIMQGRKCPLVFRDELKEFNFGTWEGKTREETYSFDAEQSNNFWNKPEIYRPANGGESFADVRFRVVPFLKEIAALHGGKKILIVSHAGTVKTIMGYFEDRPIDKYWDSPGIESTSLSHVLISDSGNRILEYADASHL